MLFNSAAYMLFLPVVVLLYWLLPFRYRTLFLLAASYFFYMTWKPIYGILIIGLTAFNYFAGLKLAASPTRKGLYLTLGVAANLLILAYFKYTYLAIDAVNGIATAAGAAKFSYPVEQIILPLGISFFAFEFIHYLVDVYRGHKPIKAPLEFALFPSFFPTQIAGPIKRYQDFVPQLHTPRTFSIKQFDQGVELILWGLCRKVLLADNIAVVVDKCLAHPELLSSADTWLIFYAFAFQVYFDFSAYTDIARGSAALMGFSVPINFDLPYLSGSMREFWRKWHLSLSTWLRDYLFVPLGGSKGTFVKTLFITLVVMTLCGLWHGAGFNYVMFGFMHGVLLVGNRLWRAFVENKANPLSPFLMKLTAAPQFYPFAVFINFQFYITTLVFFRLNDWKNIGITYQRLLFMNQPAGLGAFDLTIPTSEGPANYAILPVLVAILILAQILTKLLRDEKETPGVLNLPNWLTPLRPAYLAALAVLLLLFAPDGTPSFIYFQF